MAADSLSYFMLPASLMHEINAVQDIFDPTQDTHYDYYGSGIPREFRMAECPDAIFRNVERVAELYSYAGARFLVHTERIQYEELILHVEYITTRVAHENPLGGWIRQSVCYLEGTLSPYPYDIDIVHPEGDFQALI